MLYNNIEDEIYCVSEQLKILEKKVDKFLDDDSISEEIRSDVYTIAVEEGVYQGKHYKRSVQSKKGYMYEI
ncbi:MAG: hypothetical protein RBR68_07315 [Tenuifilaceae bacterium]|nr:hypothetical protein [Tenuifilaceae bacterium]